MIDNKIRSMYSMLLHGAWFTKDNENLYYCDIDIWPKEMLLPEFRMIYDYVIEESG